MTGFANLTLSPGSLLTGIRRQVTSRETTHSTNQITEGLGAEPGTDTILGNSKCHHHYPDCSARHTASGLLSTFALLSAKLGRHSTPRLSARAPPASTQPLEGQPAGSCWEETPPSTSCPVPTEGGDHSSRSREMGRRRQRRDLKLSVPAESRFGKSGSTGRTAMVAGTFLELLPSGLFGEVIHSPLLCNASPGLSPPLLPHQPRCLFTRKRRVLSSPSMERLRP